MTETSMPQTVRIDDLLTSTSAAGLYGDWTAPSTRPSSTRSCTRLSSHFSKSAMAEMRPPWCVTRVAQRLNQSVKSTCSDKA